MKGYKGFEPGLVCRDKQYAENTVFEEPSAVICSSGMHFCENPFDVLDHYDLVRNDGSFNEFAEVEALDEVKTDDNRKYCTKKLKIGAKLTFGGFIKCCVDFAKDKTTLDHGTFNDAAQIRSSGDAAKIGSSGDAAKIGSSGNAAKIGSSGEYAQIGSSGDAAQIGSSGNAAKIGSSGDYAQIGSSGQYAQIGSSGDAAKIGSSGDAAKIDCTGQNAVICCAGHGSEVKAKAGCWITLSEWSGSVPVCVKTEYVDGVRIKADTWYKLVDGEFKEVEAVEL